MVQFQKEQVGNTELLVNKKKPPLTCRSICVQQRQFVVLTGDQQQRTLQERLDENVRIRPFGAQGDGPRTSRQNLMLLINFLQTQTKLLQISE